MARVLRLLDTFDFVSDDDKAVALSLMFSSATPRLTIA